MSQPDGTGPASALNHFDGDADAAARARLKAA
jgi:hypothetical protein